jgi:putative transcriptional regulator
VTDTVDFSGHFLMAMPGLVGDDFAGALIYVCEHSERGALGLVINRPIDLTLASLLEKVEMPAQAEGPTTMPVFFGGPVQTDRGFVLHHPVGDYSSSIHLNDSMALTTSRDVLQALASGVGPEQFLVTLGYAGWGAGQLEHEIAQNSWLTVLASPSVIFGTPPEERYPAAMRLLGIDPAMLAGTAGHA